MRHELRFGFETPFAERRGGNWVVTWDDCRVMGILNATPDSFSDGGQHFHLSALLETADKMKKAGVWMLDIGGESTRPGATPVEAATELDRVLPAIHALRDCGLLLSVDTMKPEVAAAALEAGAHVVNDVTGLRDPEMRRVCAEAGAPACVMHMQGEPQTMQQNPEYGDVLAEVSAYLEAAAGEALAAGVPSVLLDPGIGFGKTLEHNVALLRGVSELAQLGHPLLVGASRKRIIEHLTGVSDPLERDAGSLSLHLWAAREGAALVRVHAAAEHVQALRVQAALQ